MSQNIQVIVNPHPNSEDPTNSRSAHFNWLVESENGSEAIVGQYPCGSYWVAPNAGDVGGVRFLSLTGNPLNLGADADLLTVDADPNHWDLGLLDGSNSYGNHNPTEDEVPNLPKVFSSSSGSCISLVAAMQRNEGAAIPVGEGGGTVSDGGTVAIVGENTDAYCVVTVLSEPPANNGADSIRPNIVGTTKHLLSWSDFDLTSLPSLSKAGSMTALEISTEASRVANNTEVFSCAISSAPNIKYSEGGRAYRAQLLFNEYGADWGASMGAIYEAIIGTNTIEEKKPLLAALISCGLDQYHHRYSLGGPFGEWTSGAGQSTGNATPVFFAVALLDSTNPTYKTWQENLKRVSYENQTELDPRDQGPQEMRQIRRGPTGTLVWGDDHVRVRPLSATADTETVRRYWAELEARRQFDGATPPTTTGGAKNSCDPHGYIDGPPEGPGESYMSVTQGGFRTFSSIYALFPKFKELVNSPEVFEYTDRITRFGKWASPDPAATPSAADQANACDPFSDPLTCVDWRVTWGPTPTDWRSPILGGSGRFTSRHGQSFYTGGGDWTNYTFAGYSWQELKSLIGGSDFSSWSTATGRCPPPDIFMFSESGQLKCHLTCGLDDAVIKYTTDGSTPTDSSTVYDGTPLNISGGQEVRGISQFSGKTDSRTITRIEGGVYSIDSTMTDPDIALVRWQSALDTIKADCDTLNTAGGGAATVNSSSLLTQDYEAAINTQYSNQQSLNAQIGNAATISQPSGTFEQVKDLLVSNNISIENNTP